MGSLSEFDKELVAKAISEFSSDDVHGFNGAETSKIDKKYHLLPVEANFEHVSSSRKYDGLEIFQRQSDGKYCVTFRWHDNERAEKLREIERIWDDAGMRRGYGNHGPWASHSYWKHSVLSEHDKKTQAQRAMLKVATEFKKRSDDKYSEKVLTAYGTPLKGKLGESKTLGHIGDLVTYADHTYGQGWLWQIISEDNNPTQWTGERHILTIRPVWTGMKTTIDPKEKTVSCNQVEPASLIELGQTFSALQTIIEQEYKRRSGTEKR